MPRERRIKTWVALVFVAVVLTVTIYVLLDVLSESDEAPPAPTSQDSAALGGPAHQRFSSQPWQSQRSKPTFADNSRVAPTSAHRSSGRAVA
jgi:hypothetical protein